MGKKSKKGKSRATHQHGKKKRAAQTSTAKTPASSTSTPTATAATVPTVAPTVVPTVVPTVQPTPPPVVAETTQKLAEELAKAQLREKIAMNVAIAQAEQKAQAAADAEAAAQPRTIVQTMSEESLSIPNPLTRNLHLMTPYQAKLANNLCRNPTNQSHIFEKWSVETNEDDDQKTALMQQLERMDKSYPSGGLVGYIKNAKELLEQSRKGVNPLEGWVPSVPDGEMFEIGTDNYNEFEEVGLGEIGKCGFALVAGGLGERLGFGGIKLGLPTELATETTYLQYYIETILAIQSRYSTNIKLPLCIMVSNDTSAGTTKLLEENNYYGMEKDQITIVQQGDGVPALMDNDATITMNSSDPYKIQAKPHGHGDIHALLHSNGVAKKWCKNGLEWVIFFQDTNGLAFHTLPLALGVSKKRGLVMNSIAVPRSGGQAVGGVTKLKNVKTGEERTINVEYNQLDPLLRANGYIDGDVNDETTGFSPFPGNINQLLFQLKPYAKALERTKGAMPEFVNPKYADAAKTIFKKPTRLECMMQDFPTILDGDESKHVGFTSIAADLCFSPVKNATSDGVNLQSKGTAPGVAATGEADQYAAMRKIMTSIGCQVEDAQPAEFDGIKIVPGPEIVLKPSFAVCPAEYKKQFPCPSKIKISSRSSLVVEGCGVVIESLDLDGALVIKCEEGASGVIRNLVVRNNGWRKVNDTSPSNAEYLRIRGYRLEKDETKFILFKKDGSIEGYVPLTSAIQQAKEPAVSSIKKAASKERKVDANMHEAPDLSRPSTPENMKQPTCCCIC